MNLRDVTEVAKLSKPEFIENAESAAITTVFLSQCFPVSLTNGWTG